jgi:FKBP-type peptidyl-prolyl cis-trans isomerase FkpA
MKPTRYGMTMKLRRTSGISTILLAGLAVVICSCSRPRGPNAIDADAPTEFTTTESGLKYRILRKSSGRKPIGSSRVSVDYSGWLDDTSVFDSSYKGREPVEFVLSNVIAGWTEGLQLVGEGGMIELEVPPELGYGAAGQSGIPPNSTLHFRIELHGVQ